MRAWSKRTERACDWSGWRMRGCWRNDGRRERQTYNRAVRLVVIWRLCQSMTLLGENRLVGRSLTLPVGQGSKSEHGNKRADIQARPRESAGTPPRLKAIPKIKIPPWH